MPGRYSGPLGKEFRGNRAQAMELQGVARKLVEQCFDHLKGRSAAGKGCQYMTQTLWDGSTVHAYVLGNIQPPIVRTWIESPYSSVGSGNGGGAPSYVFLGTVWKPRGLVVTPKSESMPFGCGFPKRDRFTGERINPPWGTIVDDKDNAILGQAIFNHAENNYYLDHPDYIKGLETWFIKLPDNPCLRDAVAINDKPLPLPPGTMPKFYRHWPPGYKPRLLEDDYDNTFWEVPKNIIEYIDDPGLNKFQWSGVIFEPFKQDKDTPLCRQFDGFESKIFEEEKPNSWHCHWAEENLYENAAFESVFQGVNAERDAVGVLPMTRPIRGVASPAFLTVAEMQRAKAQFHDNEDLYRPGYGTILNRMAAVNPNWGRIAENGLTTGYGDLGKASTGTKLVADWVSSSLHYAGMIDEAWGTPSGGVSLDIAGGVVGLLTEIGDPYPQVLSTPYSVYFYSMWYMKHNEYKPDWVSSSLFVNKTPYGDVGTRGTGSFLSTQRTMDQRFDSVYHAGHIYELQQIFDRNITLDVVARIIGASIFEDEKQTPWFTAIVYEGPGYHANFDESLLFQSFVAYKAPLNASTYPTEWKEVARIRTDELFEHIYGGPQTACTFTSDGRKGVFNFLAPEFLDEDFDFARYRSYPVFFENDTFTIGAAVSYDSSFPAVYVGGKFGRAFYMNSVEYEKPSSAYYYYDFDDTLKQLNVQVDIEHEIEEGQTTYEYWKINHTLTLGDGTVIVLARQELSGQVLLSPGVLTSILYFDPRTQDIITAESQLNNGEENSSGVEIIMDLTMRINNSIIATYPAHTQVENTQHPITCWGRNLYPYTGDPPFGYDYPQWHVEVQFARFDDRWACDLLLYQLNATFSNDLVNGDRYIEANFPIEDELGIGPLTKLAPLGVV